MRLTREEHPESLKRYRHIKRSGRGQKVCYQLCPGSARTCGRQKGHRGPHAAFGLFRRVLAVWDVGGSEASAPPPAPVRARGRTPIGLRSQRPDSPFDLAKTLVRSAFSSPEELAWFIFFLTFVGFAIGGFLLIYLG